MRNMIVWSVCGVLAISLSADVVAQLENDRIIFRCKIGYGPDEWAIITGAGIVPPILPDIFCVGPDGSIYLAQCNMVGNLNIKRFMADGSHLVSYSFGDKESVPLCMAVDSSNRIYVAKLHPGVFSGRYIMCYSQADDRVVRFGPQGILEKGQMESVRQEGVSDTPPFMFQASPVLISLDVPDRIRVICVGTGGKFEMYTFDWETFECLEHNSAAPDTYVKRLKMASSFRRDAAGPPGSLVAEADMEKALREDRARWRVYGETVDADGQLLYSIGCLDAGELQIRQRMIVLE